MDTAERKCDDGGHGDIHGGAGGVGGDGVETDGDAEHTGAGDEDPPYNESANGIKWSQGRGLTENKGTSQNDSAGLPKKQLTDIVNAVDLTMPQLEDTDDIVGPRRNGSNGT